MTASAAVRARAAQVIALVSDSGKSLESDWLENGASAQERGLLRSLCYGTVRWHFRLAALLKALLDQPPHKLEPEVRALALVGLFQLLYTDIAPHAVIAETVEAATVLRRPRAKGLLNAVLRRAQREAATLLPAIDQDLATRVAHPRWLVEQLSRDWPKQFNSILAANNQHPPFWLRVNRRRATREEYAARLAKEGIQSEPSLYAPDALLLARAMDVRVLPGFQDGIVSVQDAAAQLAAHLLEAQGGDRVLDACAAPGGKTCHILEIQPDLAELLAIDIAPARLKRIRENCERLGLEATLEAADAADPQAWWDGRFFNRILLDVPCSATGVIRRHPDIKLLRRADDIAALSVRQSAILKRSWELLAPGGRLVYASCSALRAENAAVVSGFLAERGDARDVTPNFGLPFDAADPGMRIPAGEAGMDGFYYACLEKKGAA